MSTMPADSYFMSLAIGLAEDMLGATGDNPSVGCVIVEDGEVIAAAATGEGGRPHAEEQALAELDGDAEGLTAYVTLEPCRERSTGKPSCSQLLIASGIARVVYAAADPHPNGSGGLSRLLMAGVEVVYLPMPEAVEALYGAWFSDHKSR